MKKIKLFKKKTNSGNNTKKVKEKKVMWKSILSIGLFIAIILVSLFLIFALYIVITSPDFEQKKLYQKEPTILYDRNGNEFARVGAENSTVIKYEDIPDVLVDALVATEDSRFFQHNGIDLFRFLKASVLQVLGSNSAGGASTLSMQVIKNTYTNSTSSGMKGIIRKFTDIYMSVFKLEAKFTKEEIIEFYFNSQWFANDGNINVTGIVGIEQASIYFFGKSSKDLNLAEATLLVGMFQNTRLHNPYNYPESAKKRQETVLKLMVRHGYITEEEKDAVLEIPISSMLVVHNDVRLEVKSNQAFIDYVIKEVNNDLGINAGEGAYKIYTTFDPEVQSVLEQVEKGEIYKFPDDAVQEGIAVTSVEDGSIVALSGGRNYKAHGYIYATDIKRQPGSTAKPIFDYAMYIEHISQSTYAMFLDEKTTYSNGQSITNYDNGHKGLISMRYALEDSRNIPALLAFKKVAALDQTLIENFVHSVGIDYGDTLYESASIGGLPKGVSPLELAAAYATFGRGGYYIEPYSYTRVVNTETNEDKTSSYTKQKVMEESTAYMINNILIGVYGGLSAKGTQTAGKTGTTNLDSDTRKQYGLPVGSVMDAWIVSYSPSYSISLWYGYDSLVGAAETGHYLNSNTGGTARRRIMNGLAQKIHKPGQSFKIPKTITSAKIETETFPPQLCSEYTPSNMCSTEFFVNGTEPTDVSSRFNTLSNPTDGDYSFSGNTITLTWTPIETPNAIDSTYLLNHFNELYGNYAEKYYNNRIKYNNTNIGTLGYQIYLRNSNGSETYLGYTSSNSFNYIVPTGGSYTFIIRTAYSIFTSNRSSGLTINAKTIDSNIGSILPDDEFDENDEEIPNI